MGLPQMSLQGAVLIAVIAALRYVCKNRLPKQTFLILWGVAIARLLLPFSVPSRFSAYRAAQSPVLQNSLLQNPVIPALRAPANAALAAKAGVPLWAALWAAGTVALSLWFVYGYVRFRREFRFSLPVQDPFATQWLKEHPVRRTVRLRQSGCISAPLTYGVFRPVILFPKGTDFSDTEQIRYILMHEMVHIRRFDPVWKLLATAALCLHWLNPLVWLMCLLFGRDLELACDARVIRQLGEPLKSAYALTLIRMEEQKSGLAPFSNHFSRTAIEERIRSIMRFKKAPYLALAAAIVLVLTVTMVFATTASDRTQMLPEDAEILKQFQFPNYQNLTVSDFQERASKLLDQPEIWEWWLEIESNDEYYSLQDTDPMCGFLYHVLLDQYAAQQHPKAYNGAGTTWFIPSQNPAILEYCYEMHILDPARLTVGEYQAARDGVGDSLSGILNDFPWPLLSDEAVMNTRLSQQLPALCETWSSDSLHIELTDFFYQPPDSAQNQYENETKATVAGVPRDFEGDSDAENEDFNREAAYRATPEDYASVLTLKTPDYKTMTLETFNANLLEWANENYDRMERVSISAARDESANGLTAEEKEFIALTVSASGAENGSIVRSLYTGRPEEDPVFSGGDLVEQQAQDGRAAWCELYYQYAYHVADRAATTVGERDRCIQGFLQDIEAFWRETSFEERLKMSESQVVSKLQDYAQKNSTPNVTLHIDSDMVSYDCMDERAIN